MTDEPPERERLKAIAAPLFAAVGLAQDLREMPRDLLQPLLNPAASQAPGPVSEVHNIVTPQSMNQDWHGMIVEVASTLGVSERRSPDEILRDVEAIFNITSPSGRKEDALAAVAEKLGLKDSRGNSYISLLESVGAKLGVKKEYYFDQNLYYSEAEKDWVEGIAKKLRITLTRRNEEILLRVGEKLGVKFAPEETEEVAMLERITSGLGISPAGDKVAMLSRIESALRAKGSIERR